MMSAEKLVAAGKAAVEAGHYDEAVVRFDAVVAYFGDATDSAARQLVAYALGAKADALRAAGALEESLHVRDELIARFGDDSDDYLRTLVSISFDRKARALDQLGRHEEQFGVRDAELARYALAEPAGRPAAYLDALVGRAIALFALGRHREAVADWDEVLGRVEGATDPAARRKEVMALVYRAGNLRVLGEYRAALADLEQLQDRFTRTDDPWVAEKLADGLLEQVWVWREMGLPELAGPALERLITEFASDTNPSIVNDVTRGLMVRAEGCYRGGELDTADGLYDLVLERGRATTDGLVWDAVIDATAGKAWVLARRGAVDEGLRYLDEWLQETRERFPARLGCVAHILYSKIGILAWVQRNEDVVSVAEEIVDQFGNSDEPTLRKTIAFALLERAFALGYLGRECDGLSAFEALHEYPDEVLAVLDEQVGLIERNEDPTVVAQHLAPKLLLRASILRELDRDMESAEVLSMLIERFADSDYPGVLAAVGAARQALAGLGPADLDE